MLMEFFLADDQLKAMREWPMEELRRLEAEAKVGTPKGLSTVGKGQPIFQDAGDEKCDLVWRPYI
jgi:hypothetical protein